MTRFNRDTWIAIALLVITAVFAWASFAIREPDYGVLSPAAWPRAIIVALGFLSVLLLIQSISESPGGDEADPVSRTTPETSTATDAESADATTGFMTLWWNPLFCFAAFLGFLLALPYLGMLVGGITFVFALLTLLGGASPKKLALHAAIAVISIGTMWAIFTFGLKVLLPTGSLFGGLV